MRLQIKKNMTPSKPSTIPTPPPSSTSSSNECCMCGDYGFSYELFQCKVCQFRSQHRYCSNMYPNVMDSHSTICNWCLDDTKEKSSNSSSTSSFKNDNSTTIIKKTMKKVNKDDDDDDDGDDIAEPRRGRIGPIKKQRSMEVEPIMKPRKRLIGTKEQKRLMRRTTSVDVSSNAGFTKHVFRYRVRRYKLLDEVSS